MSLRQLAVDIVFNSGAAVTDLLKVDSIIDEISEKAPGISDKLGGIGDGISDFGKKMSLGITAPVVAFGTLSAKAAIEFESAFAGIRKTVDMTETEYAELSEGIREMSKEIPASAAAIAEVGEAAGQLGIDKENILSFSRTIIDLSESTNLSAEQASTEFARFANIVGMSQSDFDRMGSSIVGLGKKRCPVVEKSAA